MGLLPVRRVAAGQPFFEFGGRHYGHMKVSREREETGVAGHQRVGSSGKRELQERRSKGSRHAGTAGGGFGTATVSQKGR